mgnify:CR=1 FL=1
MGQGGSAEPPRSPYDDPPDLAHTALVPPAAETPLRLTLIPTVLQWSHGGRMVYVTGTFNNWAERIPMRQSRNDFTVCLNLPVGTFQYKFIVDNEWRFSPSQPLVQDAQGNVNNCITVLDEEVRALRERLAGGLARIQRGRAADASAGARRAALAPPWQRGTPRARRGSPQGRPAALTRPTRQQRLPRRRWWRAMLSRLAPAILLRAGLAWRAEALAAERRARELRWRLHARALARVAVELFAR